MAQHSVVSRPVDPEPGLAEQATPGPQRRLRADAVRNRARLLDAAAAMFAEHGAEVPLEDVARRADVGIGTLYRHFPTRDALVEAVYRHEVEVLCLRADQLLTELPPDQALAEWMRLFVQHVRTKRGMLSVLKPMLASNTSLSEVKGRATDCASRLVAAGVAAGTIRGDIDGADVVRALGGICMSIDEDQSRAGQRLVNVIADGLRVTSG
jgi:AcrR family transcriptional regulator